VTIEEHKEFASRIDAENDRQNHRLEKLEDSVAEIQRLTIAVEKMAISTESMAKEIQRQGERLDAIEKEPADNWKKVTWEILKYAIVLALGIIAVKVGAAV